MTNVWDRFAAGAGEMLDTLGYEQNVRLFEPAESYSPGDGFDAAYPDRPTATLAGAVTPPSATTDTDEGGTTRAASLVIHVRSREFPGATEAGEGGEAPTRVRVAQAPGVYHVEAIEPQGDGLTRLSCAEVDVA